MGPQQAEEALRTCLSVGADDVVLVSGREFGGSDTLATSYIITCAIKKLEEQRGEKFDVIFCGKQAIDGDTGQVGPECAEHLGYPQITYATEVVACDGKTIRIRKETVAGYEVLESAMPLVVSVTKTPSELRNPNVRLRLAANRAEIPVITAQDLEGIIDLTHCGLKGSPTRVKKSFTPVHDNNCTLIEAETLSEAGTMLVDRLDADKKF